VPEDSGDRELFAVSVVVGGLFNIKLFFWTDYDNYDIIAWTNNHLVLPSDKFHFKKDVFEVVAAMDGGNVGLNRL
jgi:hypothetical protein